MEAFAWPIVGLILGVIALFMFKNPFTRLLDRTEKISKDGLQAKNQQELSNDQTPSKIEEIIKNYNNDLLVETENLIKSTISELKPKSDKEREQLLIRSYASLSISASFDRTYYLIFGSQILALHYLSERRSVSQTIENVKTFFEGAKEKYPSIYDNYSFEKWVGYLVTTGLIQKNGDDIGITIRGKEFLKYLLDQGYSFVKQG